MIRLVAGVALAAWAVYYLAHGRLWNAAWLAVFVALSLLPPFADHFGRADADLASSSLMRGYALKCAAVAALALVIAVFALTRGDTARGALALIGCAAFAYIALRITADSQAAAKSESQQERDRL